MTTIFEQLNGRFANGSPFGRTSASPGLAWARVAKYEEALKALARELTRVKEKERQKIAEQLHDEFGQDLLVAKMRLTQLLNKLPPRYGNGVEEVADIIGDLIRRTRTLIDELIPQRLCEHGLKAALQALAKDLQMKHRFICTAKLDLMPKLLKDEVQQVLFRAVRELLFNVVKHARASRVEIAVMRKPGSVAIEVSDDGQGFDPRQTVLSDLSIGRFGLSSVRADLAPLGGILRIFSGIHKGTIAIITMPIEDG